MELHGIDISEYQQSVNWSKVKNAGIGFVMIRASYGRNSNQKDKMLASHVAGCESVGLPYGFYHYSYALTAEDAKKEAALFLSAIAPYSPAFPVAYDVEDASQAGLTVAKRTDIACAFLDAVAAAGYYVMLYASQSWLVTKFDSRIKNYDIWLAQWASKPSLALPFGIWQHTASGSVDGISGACDRNIAYTDYPAVIKAAGLNGWERASQDEPAPASNEPTPAANTTDSTPDGYAAEAVKKAVAAGILRGDGNGDLMLHKAVTRQDLMVILDRCGMLG